MSSPLRSRPGAVLLELLGARGLTIPGFIRLSQPGIKGADLTGAVANLRRYAFRLGRREVPWPAPEVVEGWAKLLGVDAGRFYAGPSSGPGRVAEPKSRSCNRHADCDAAARAGPTFHCHDDCCEDCFGS